MRILNNNLITTDNLTVNNESAAFPALNLLSNALVEKVLVDTYFDIDLGAATNITSIGLITDEDMEVWAGASVGASTYTKDMTGLTVAFIDETYRYWRFVMKTPASNQYVNYASIGLYTQIDALEQNAVPTPIVTDSTSVSASGQIYSTEGSIVKSMKINAIGMNATSYEAINTWFYSSDRKNNYILVPFEGDMTTYPYEPFFGRIMTYGPVERFGLSYDVEMTLREGK